MGFIGRLKFNRRFFAGLLLVLVVFGVFGGNLEFGVTVSSVRAESAPVTINWGGLWEGIRNSYVGRLFISYNEDTATDDAYDLTQMGASDNDTIAEEKSLGVGAFLLDKAASVLDYVVSNTLYDEVFFSKTAKEALSFAWGVVRDFVNMFYLLILIFLAITTILRVNKFSDKKLFFNVIVSAILVNFSLPITLVVIDFSNMLMNFFVQAIHNSLNGQSLGAYFLQHTAYSTGFSFSNMIKGIGVSLFQFIIEVAMATMLFFTAISLLIRLIAYWVLIILSPLAFFSIALPNSGGFQEWKDKLINYSFYGPIMLFFIWLSLLLLGKLNEVFNTNRITGWSHWIQFIVSYVVVMYLLYYGHDKSKAMATKAGDTASMLMKKGGDYAVRAGKGAAIIHPAGTAGFLGYQYGKSRAKAEYVGMKTAMESGRYGKMSKLLTKKGREEEQEELDFKAKMRHADKNTKERLMMERLLVKEEKEIREKYGDLESKDTLERIARIGTQKQKMVAYLKLAERGALSGENLKNAMEIGKQNDLYKNTLIRRMGDRNKVAMTKYYLDDSKTSHPASDTETFVNNKIKTLMGEWAHVRDDKDLMDRLEDNKVSKEDLEKFVKKLKDSGINKERAIHFAMFSEAGNLNDVVKLLNEKMPAKERDELAKSFAAYLRDSRFNGQGLVAGANMDKMMAMLNRGVSATLRREGVFVRGGRRAVNREDGVSGNNNDGNNENNTGGPTIHTVSAGPGGGRGRNMSASEWRGRFNRNDNKKASSGQKQSTDD